MTQDGLWEFKLNIRMVKKWDLSDFDCGIVVGARLAGLSVSETDASETFVRGEQADNSRKTTVTQTTIR